MATEFFTLEAVPARYGDCLLLHYGTEEKPGLALIDGGPSQVWQPFLKPRLEAIDAVRTTGFHIDLLMVSHIDDDHVLGMVDFLAAWDGEKSAGRPWPYPVRQAWFNSFERLSNAKDIGAVTASVTASTGSSTLTAIDPEMPAIVNRNKDEARAGLKVLASVRNGKKLRDYLDKLKVPTNTGFDGDLVRPGHGPKVPYKLGAELTLHVIGPLPDELADLQKKFARELEPNEALAAYTDSSVPNLSSIVALARYKGKSILLTGDARGDYILDGLRRENLLAASGKIHVDVLKLPHHGSDRNVDPSFFTTITADNYVASADGTHGNPDRATLEMLIEQRGKDAGYTIQLTYPLDIIDDRRRAEWEKDRQSEIDKQKETVRRAWNADTDDLRALFEDRLNAGYKFKLSVPREEGQSNKVELLAPVPF